MEGYIKLHRKLLEWEWFDNPKMISVWIYCLLKANHNGNYWHRINITRGSFITSVDKISRDTGVSVHSVRNCLDNLKLSENIVINTTNKFTMVTICNYEIYQQEETKKGKQKSDTSQSGGNETSTNNNDKKDKNIKTEYKYSQFYDYQLEVSDAYKLKFPDSTISAKYQSFVDWLFNEGQFKKVDLLGNTIGHKKTNLLSLRDQLTFDEFGKLQNKCVEHKITINEIFKDMENWDLSKKLNMYDTALNFIKRRFK